MEPPVDVERNTHDAAYGHRRDKQHGILALGQVGDHGIQPDGKARQPQRVIQHILVFILDALVQSHPDERPRDNGARIDNRSNHRPLNFILNRTKVHLFLSVGKCELRSQFRV